MMHCEKIAELTGHASAVYCLEKGRWAHTIFSGSSDGFVAEWNLETLSPEKFSVKFESPVFSMLHVQEKNMLVVGLFNGNIHLVDLLQKKEIKCFHLPSKGIFALCFDESTNRLYSGGADGVFNVWNMETLEHMLSLPICEGKIRKIILGRTHDEIFLCCGDGYLRALETDFFNETFSSLLHEGGVYTAMLTKGELVTAGKDAHIKISDRFSMSLLDEIPAHNYGIYKVISWNSFWVSCSRDKTIKIWDPVALSQPLRLDFKYFKGHTHAVNDLLISEWNNYLISAGDDRKIIIWKLANR